MKSFLFAAFASAGLLTSTGAFATPFDHHDRDDYRYEQQRPGDRDGNYGYAQNHRVSPRSAPAGKLNAAAKPFGRATL